MKKMFRKTVSFLMVSLFTVLMISFPGQVAKAETYNAGIITKLTTTSGDNLKTWNNAPIVMRISASLSQDLINQGDKVASIGYQLDGMPEKEVPVSGVEYIDLPSLSENGYHIIRIWSRDTMGQRSPNVSQYVGIDTEQPTIKAVITQTTINGWYNSNVVVHFVGNDYVSGISSITPDITLWEDGTDKSVTGTVYDSAGNSATVTVGKINIDKTGPVITGAATTQPNENLWYKAPVIVHFEVTDALSGIVPNTVIPDVTLSNEGENQSAQGSAKDLAGNENTAVVNGINIDMTAPNVTGAATTLPNQYDWYNGPVTVHFDATDALSGIDPKSVTQDITLTGSGQNQSVQGSAKDLAGNENSAVVNGINIDTKAPTVEFEGVEDGGTVFLGQQVKWNAYDDLSGLVTASSDTLDTSSLGQKTVSVTAIDRAGNSTTTVLTYTVQSSYNFVLQNKTKKLDVVKQGSNLTVKFQLTDASGNYITTATAKITLLKDGTEIVPTATNNTTNSFRYDYTENQYVYNLNTKDLEKADYTIKISLNDGSTYEIPVSLR